MIDFLGPAVVAAFVSAVVSVVGVFVNRATTIRMGKERFDFEKTLAEQKQSDELKLAERKFGYERGLYDHQRRVELAEEVLAGFYQSADIVREIRLPGGVSDEGAPRDRTENETLAQASKLDAYFVPMARIAQHSDFFSGLKSKRYRSRALLGQSIDEAFAALDAAVGDVQAKAIFLTTLVKNGVGFEHHQQLVGQCEATIWQLTSDDSVELRVKRAIEVAENVCRPILVREGSPDAPLVDADAPASLTVP